MRIQSYIICLFIYIVQVYSYYIHEGTHSNTILNNFAFGSCYGGFLKKRTDIFSTIIKRDPDLWLWLGDATYLDRLSFNYFRKDFGYDKGHVENMFNETKYDEYYFRLSQKCPVIGIWDDHDYGMNDANRHFRYKEEIKKYYLDFLDEPKNSSRRKVGDGLYTSYSFGDPTTHKTVRLILLDVRYDKDSIYLDKNPDILGNKQWNWLDETLKNANETFIFIASGTQIMPFNRLVTEAWYPLSRQKLFDLIGKYKKNGVVFLSGDIHMAEILKTFCTLPEVGYDIYEITSSGMSHYAWFSVFLEKIFANDYSIKDFIRTYNFAKIDFIWGNNKNESKFNISIIDIDNIIRTSLVLSYEEISYKKIKEVIPKGERDCRSKIISRFKSFNEYINYYKRNPISILPVLGFVFFVFSICYMGFLGFYKILKLIYHYFKRNKCSKINEEKKAK